MTDREELTADLVLSARQGDREGHERLGGAVLRLAEAAAWRTGARGADLEDLRQAGALAALEALLGPSWDPQKGGASSYAYRAAARAISRQSDRLESPVSYSRSDRTARVAVQRARRQLEKGGRPAPAEIAELAGEPHSEVAAALDPVVPMDAPVARQALRTAEDEAMPKPAGSRSGAKSRGRDRLMAMLDSLTPRQRTVLDLRCGLTGPAHSLREIGEILDIPKSRVWRTIRSATARLEELEAEEEGSRTEADSGSQAA